MDRLILLKILDDVPPRMLLQTMFFSSFNTNTFLYESTLSNCKNFDGMNLLVKKKKTTSTAKGFSFKTQKPYSDSRLQNQTLIYSLIFMSIARGIYRGRESEVILLGSTGRKEISSLRSVHNRGKQLISAN